MSDYRLMTKMHTLLKMALVELEAAHERIGDPFLKDNINSVMWDIRDLLKEAEGAN